MSAPHARASHLSYSNLKRARRSGYSTNTRSTSHRSRAVLSLPHRAASGSDPTVRRQKHAPPGSPSTRRRLVIAPSAAPGSPRRPASCGHPGVHRRPQAFGQGLAQYAADLLLWVPPVAGGQAHAPDFALLFPSPDALRSDPQQLGQLADGIGSACAFILLHPGFNKDILRSCFKPPLSSTLSITPPTVPLQLPGPPATDRSPAQREAAAPSGLRRRRTGRGIPPGSPRRRRPAPPCETRAS